MNKYISKIIMTLKRFGFEKSRKLEVSDFIQKYFKNSFYFIIVCTLFIVLIFTRLYDMEGKSPFGYDQVDNAWAAKNIIIDGNLPLTGMQAKGNTGFFIGPYYYYFLVPFYYLTSLDPIASIFAATFVSIITFFIIYGVARSIFDEKVAVLALFIHVASSYILELDRVQWPVNFVVPIAFLIFFSLYKIIIGKTRYILLLALTLGISLHIHFTSVFYFIIILPFVFYFPRKKETVKYFLYSLPIIIFFVFPIVINTFLNNADKQAFSYLSNSYHGFHLTRFFQISGDGLIEFNAILKIPYAIYFSIFLFCAYLLLLVKSKIKGKKFLISASLVWVIVPWLLFSTYSGELTNYYFSSTRVVVILCFSLILSRLLSLRPTVIKGVVVIALGVYAIYNINYFLNTGPVGLSKHREEVLEKIAQNEKIEFVHGSPQSYLYYYYTQIKDEKK